MTLTSLQLTPRPAEPAIPRDLIDKPTITIGNETFDIDAGDLESLCVLGRGAYGVVEKMKLRQTGTILAVKVKYVKYFQGYTEMEYLILVSCMHTVKVLLKHTV